VEAGHESSPDQLARTYPWRVLRRLHERVERQERRRKADMIEAMCVAQGGTKESPGKIIDRLRK
jgi:hypothetical protein